MSPAEDYKYLLSAMQSHPERLLGVFVADPTVAEPEKWMDEIAKSSKNWVPRWSCASQKKNGPVVDLGKSKKNEEIYGIDGF